MPRRPRNPKSVHWTVEEETFLCEKGLEIRDTRSDLAGYHLLNEAQQHLPPERRRPLSTLRKVTFFEVGLVLAAKARAARHELELAASRAGPQPVVLVRQPGDPLIGHIDEHKGIAADLNHATEQWARDQMAAIEGLEGHFVENNRLLHEILDAVRALKPRDA